MARTKLRNICLVTIAAALVACSGGGGGSSSASGASAPTGSTTSSGGGETTSSATLEWNPNTDSDLAGYRIYRATASGAYGAPIAAVASDTTTYVVNGLTPATYFFVVSAFDTSGNESGFSNEVSKTVP